MLAKIGNSTHRQFLVSRGSIDDVAGIVLKDDVLKFCMASRPFDVMQAVHRPKAVHESTSILKTLELFKRTPIQMALVIDEYGGLQGIVTLTDLLEAIAGDLPQADNEEPDVKQLEDTRCFSMGPCRSTTRNNGLILASCLKASSIRLLVSFSFSLAAYPRSANGLPGRIGSSKYSRCTDAG